MHHIRLRARSCAHILSIVNAGSGDDAKTAVPGEKGARLKADFSYRETKLVYREKNYSFKGKFFVPGEFDRFIKSFSENFSNYKSLSFIQYATKKNN